jgi:hypothetical protein
MMKRTSPVLAFLPYLLVSALLCSGCALIGGGPEHDYGDASLSDAARAARGDSTHKRRRGEPEKPAHAGDVGWTPPPGYDRGSGSYTDPDIDSYDDDASTPVRVADRAPSRDAGSLLGLVFNGGSLGGATYDGYGGLGLDLGVYVTPRWRLDLVGTAAGVNFSGQSVAGQSFDNEIELAADVSTRYYVTPQHTLMGLYPIAGARLGTLFWNLARPITVTENGEPKIVKDDWVNFVSFYGGAGVSLMQIRHLHVGLNMTGGVKIYDYQTKQGFSNDLLPATGFVQTTVETTYRF